MYIHFSVNFKFYVSFSVNIKMKVLNDSYTMIPFMKENAQMKQQYRFSIDIYIFVDV